MNNIDIERLADLVNPKLLPLSTPVEVIEEQRRTATVMLANLIRHNRNVEELVDQLRSAMTNLVFITAGEITIASDLGQISSPIDIRSMTIGKLKAIIRGVLLTYIDKNVRETNDCIRTLTTVLNKTIVAYGEPQELHELLSEELKTHNVPVTLTDKELIVELPFGKIIGELDYVIPRNRN